MRSLLSSFLALGFFVFAAGCEGPVGPPGPPGGADVFSFNFDFFIEDEDINGTVAAAQFDAPDVSPAVVDDGAVLLYFRDQGTWTALPFTFGVESPDEPVVDYTATFGYAFEVGFIEVFVELSTDDDVVWDEVLASDLFSGAIEMKAVIIESFSSFAKRGIDFKNYAEVKDFFNLKD